MCYITVIWLTQIHVQASPGTVIIFHHPPPYAMESAPRQIPTLCIINVEKFAQNICNITWNLRYIFGISPKLSVSCWRRELSMSCTVDTGFWSDSGIQFITMACCQYEFLVAFITFVATFTNYCKAWTRSIHVYIIFNHVLCSHVSKWLSNISNWSNL